MRMFPFSALNREIRRYELASGQTFLIGALVVLDASEDVTECSADPASILGIALHDAAVEPYIDKIHVAIAEGGRKYWMQGDDDPTKADINQSYGVAKDGDGIWHVDGTDAVNTCLYVHDVDLERNLYLVSVLEANRQVAA